MLWIILIAFALLAVLGLAFEFAFGFFLEKAVSTEKNPRYRRPMRIIVSLLIAAVVVWMVIAIYQNWF